MPFPSTPLHLRSDVRPHLHVGEATTCPTCDQEIPADKLKEISGRIAVRMRDQEQGIRAALEKRFEIERTQADAKAAGQLEEARQQAAARVEAVREDTRKAMEAEAQEKLAAAQCSHEELASQLQGQIAQAEAARAAAVENSETLTARVEQIQHESAAALDAARASAAAREGTIRAVTLQEAAAAYTEQLNALQADHEANAAALQQQVKDARQAQAALQMTFDQALQAKSAEIETVKSEAVATAARVRQEATEAAQDKAREQIADKEQKLNDAVSRAATAEGQLAKATEQFTATLESQRETLDKARDEAVSAEKARAFEANQKLLNQVGELQRALDKKTSEELGEGAEVDLYEALKRGFPDDDIQRVAKGQPGADIIHKVMLNRITCGVIVYDSKNHKQPRTDHVTKLRTDQLAAKADHAILSALKLPAGHRQLHLQDGVLIANPARVVTLVTILRQHIVQVHTLRISAAERESKTLALYDFITSERFRHLADRIDGDAGTLLALQENEMKQHANNWKKQGELYRSIQKTTANLLQTVSGIVGTAPQADVAGEAEGKTADIFQ